MSDEAEAARLAWATIKARMHNDGETVIDCVTELTQKQLMVTGTMMMLECVYGLVTMCASIMETSPAHLWAGFTVGIAEQARESGS